MQSEVVINRFAADAFATAAAVGVGVEGGGGVAGRDLTRGSKSRALDKNVNEVEVFVKQFENEACAKHNQVQLLRHERYICRLAAAACRAQVDCDDEHSEQAHDLSKQRHKEQNILVEYVYDEVPASNRSIRARG